VHCEEVQKIWPVRKVLVFEDVREPWRYQAWTFKRRAIQRWEREAAEGRKIWFGRGWILCILFRDFRIWRRRLGILVLQAQLPTPRQPGTISSWSVFGSSGVLVAKLMHEAT
jgi:hypothetical protein